MPPRKSNASVASNGGDEMASTAADSAGKQSKDSLGIDDLSLPKSMILRLAKGMLPPNTQIQKDALLAMHKSATVFVSYIASNANELAVANGKKTIMPPDVMSSLKDAELEGFLPRLEAELKKYNEIACDKRNSYRHRVKQEKAAAAQVMREDESAATALEAANGLDGHDDDGDRPTKKMKGPEGLGVSPAGEAGDEDELMEDDQADDPEEDDDVVDDDVVDNDDDVVDATEEHEGDPPDDREPPNDNEAPGGLRDEALDEHDSD